MAKDEWKDRYLKAIKASKTNKQIGNIIDAIYEDGFQDGHSEGIDDAQKGDL